MKKYVSCLFLFLGAAAVCAVIGYFTVRYAPAQEEKGVENTTVESYEAPPDHAPAANQGEVQNISTAENPPYCLVSENGFLLVFRRGQDQVCLFTHIPIVDFPQEEQDKLREGIWFSTMMEVYSYLESYTS